jgi:hypothetical protein
MSGKRPLAGGGLRVMGNHRGWRGKAFGAHYRALAETFDLSSSLARHEASRTASRWVAWLSSRGVLEEAERQRATGKGRRPGTRELGQLRKREELSDMAYVKSRESLEKLAPRRSQGTTPADLVARLRAGGQG